MNQSKYFCSLVAACLLGFAAGHVTSDAPVSAEVRQSTPRAAFQSGSERSLQTLEVIARHVKSIDERVARIERAVSAEKKQIAKQ